ncbi:MAG: serine hydrolase [Bacteroidales bacterium]
MKPSKIVLLILGAFGLLFSCKPAPEPEIQASNAPANGHYVSLDGLWRVTPETSIKYPHGTLEPVLQLRTDAQGKLIVQGCFLWDERFYEYWPIRNLTYIDSTHQMVFDYNTEGSYTGRVDLSNGIIRGLACWGDEADTNRIDFIREEALDVNRLFIPYPPGPSGSIRYVYRQPEDCNDQLQTASLFEAVRDSAAFYAVMEKIITQKYGRLESLLILKNQKLILEEYFYGFDRTQPHPIHSCTKSVTSLLLGVALERHKLLDTDRPVFDFFPELDSLRTPEKERITLKQVLSMTSGLSEEDEVEVRDPIELASFILSHPLESAPGEEFTYNNNSTNLLGAILYELEGKQADEYAKETLFDKMGISETIWEREDGAIRCHSEMYMKPRDMAKIGQLVIQNGSWYGEQLVPAQWIAESTKPHAAESEFFDYGYQWWCRSEQNTSWWENPVRGSRDEHVMFLALGYGGQYIMVIRDLDLVVVITSSDYNEENGNALRKIPLVIEEIVPLFAGM